MYLGNQPALSYTSFAKQDFTTSATTSYTLDNPVANANELALFINFVRQEPTTAYSASGTSLTLTSATSATDDMYCVFLGKAVQTVNPPNASVGLSQLTATGTKDATTFLRGDNTFAEAGGGVNTPAFYTTRSSTQSIPHATETKVQLNTVDIDTASGFDNTTNYRYTVPSGQGGKYLITAHAMFGESISLPHTTLKKNGTRIGGNKQNSDYSGGSVVIIETLSEGDYLELFTFQYSGTSKNLQGAEDYTYLGAFKIIE